MTQRHERISMNRALEETRLRGLHWRVWWLSAMGVFLDGFDLFVIGVALPLIAREFAPNPFITGLIGASAVLGSVLGGFLGGCFTDRYGRKSLYLVDLGFFIVFGLLSAASWDVWSLILFRFLLGVGVGVDYPICASYVSEFMPSRIRGKMLIGAFSFQAVGMLSGAVAGVIILHLFPDSGAWRWMLGAGVVPAVIVLEMRTTVPESPRWLIDKGEFKKAGEIIARIVPELRDRVDAIVADTRARSRQAQKTVMGYGHLLKKQYLRRTILAVVPWFLMDIATYGIGLFTPTILAIITYDNETNFILKDLAATRGAAYLDIFLIIGFLLNIWLVDRWGRIRLQILGFGGMALGLLILSAATGTAGDGRASLYLVILGFVLFNLLMNMGPNATTFILPAELFPTSMRASVHGIATSAAKLGAALGIFLLPILKADAGIPVTLLVVAAAAVLGLIVTALFRINTTGRSLEDINPGDVR